jgi:hypothetical protein
LVGRIGGETAAGAAVRHNHEAAGALDIGQDGYPREIRQSIICHFRDFRGICGRAEVDGFGGVFPVMEAISSHANYLASIADFSRINSGMRIATAQYVLQAGIKIPRLRSVRQCSQKVRFTRLN